MTATAEQVVQWKAKGSLGHSFTFPWQLDFLKERANVTTYRCLCTPLYPPKYLTPWATLARFDKGWDLQEKLFSVLEKEETWQGRGAKRRGCCSMSWLCQPPEKEGACLVVTTVGEASVRSGSQPRDTSVVYFFLSGAGAAGVWCIKSLRHGSCIWWI